MTNEKLPLPKQEVKLTEIELLRGENLGLRIHNAKTELAALFKKQKELNESIKMRLGVDIALYQFDADTGEGTLVEKKD